MNTKITYQVVYVEAHVRCYLDFDEAHSGAHRTGSHLWLWLLPLRTRIVIKHGSFYPRATVFTSLSLLFVFPLFYLFFLYFFRIFLCFSRSEREEKTRYRKILLFSGAFFFHMNTDVEDGWFFIELDNDATFGFAPENLFNTSLNWQQVANDTSHARLFHVVSPLNRNHDNNNDKRWNEMLDGQVDAFTTAYIPSPNFVGVTNSILLREFNKCTCDGHWFSVGLFVLLFTPLAKSVFFCLKIPNLTCCQFRPLSNAVCVCLLHSV